MMKAKRWTRGETIVEALVSILIATLVFSFLTTAVVTAARINDKIRNEDVSFELDGAVDNGTATVSIRTTTGALTQDGRVYVKHRSTSGGEVTYHYYEYDHYEPESD